MYTIQSAPVPVSLTIVISGVLVKPCAKVAELPVPVYCEIENPAVVFTLILLGYIVPASAEVALAPSIFTDPAVGTDPTEAEFVVVGVPPPFQHHATKVLEPPLTAAPEASSTINPSSVKASTCPLLSFGA